jgi:hypothetical protein
MSDQDRGQPESGAADLPHLSDRELAQWKTRLADIPDLRLAKIMRLRRAIAANSYDEEMALERMLENIQNELGVLCRVDPAGDL